ncbi:MAG: TPR end-of-group domain-containing protein [Gaiellales bacterium]
MSGYQVARLDEIDEISDGRCPFRPVRHHFGITSFGVNAWTAAAAGDRLINQHDEVGGDEELYLVQSGRATFELDGDRVDAPAGTFVFAQPEVTRTAFAEEPGTTVIVLGGSPGEVYHAIGWEVWAPARALYEDGEYAEAAELTRRLIEQYPDYPALLYNLACCESLDGQADAAIEDLGRAIQIAERSRSMAASDSDFDAIRDQPGFKALVG